MNTYQKALALLTPHEKRRGALVLVLVVIMALLETAGMASILPFLAVLGNPELVETNPMLAYLYNTLGFQDVQRFLLALGVTAFAVVILAAGCRILTTYAMNRFVQMRGHSLAERLLQTYLRQPYTFFLDRHSGDLAKGVLSEVYLVLANVLRPGFYIIAYSLVALAIVLVLTLFLMADTGAGVGAVLPILGLYAFAGLKLLPAVQQIYAGASHLRFGAAAVDNLFADLRQREQLAEIARNVPRLPPPRRDIALHDVSYTYWRSDARAAGYQPGHSRRFLGRTGRAAPALERRRWSI